MAQKSEVIESNDIFYENKYPELDPEDFDVAWCSEASKKRVYENLLYFIDGKHCFSKYEVIPLLAKRTERHYRVKIYMRDCLHDGPLVFHNLWKDFYIVAAGTQSKIVDINNLVSGK